MKLTTNKQLLYQYLMVLLGFFMFVSYIWFRFIRERLPREIPFTLSLISFFTLIVIIISLGFIIYRIRYPKIPPQFVYDLIKLLIEILKPLEIFDTLLKQNSKVQRYVITIFAYIIKKLFYL